MILSSSGQAPLKAKLGDVQHWIAVKQTDGLHDIGAGHLIDHDGLSVLPVHDYLL